MRFGVARWRLCCKSVVFLLLPFWFFIFFWWKVMSKYVDVILHDPSYILTSMQSILRTTHINDAFGAQD